MNNKFNIDNESFIPEGLEFKQEYMDSAFALYGAAKKRLWWRKFFTYSGAVVLLITSAVILHFTYVSESTDKQLEVKSSSALTSGSNVASENPSQQVVDASVRIEESAQVNTNSVQDEPAIHSQIDMKEKSGNPRRTFDQGGSESSGSESPGQGSAYPDVKKANTNDLNSSVQTSSSDQEKSIEMTEPSEILKSKEEQQIADVNGLNEGVNGEVPASYEPDHSTGGILDRILSKPAVWAASPVEIERTGLIPIIPWKRWNVFFTAGLSPLAGFGSSNNQWKPDPIVSAGVEYKLHHGVSLALSGRYYSVSGMSHPYSVDHTTYGQGFTTSTETYFTDRLHYGGIGAGISKIVQHRHQFSLGYSFDYLITGNNHIVSSELSTFENRELGSRKTTGFVEGFESLNHSLQLSYQYWIGGNKAIGISYQKGLTDITKSEYFNNDGIQRNSLLSVYFRMNLTK